MKLQILSNTLKSMNLEESVLGIIREIKPQLIDLNTSQLFSGIDSTGALLKPYYRSSSYAEFKKQLNPKGVVDLRLTGAFYSKFFIDAEGFPLLFGSTDDKEPELANKYGANIFGITKVNLHAITKSTILPELQKEIRKVLQLR